MANLNFAYSSAPTRTIQEIQFGLFSAKESERLSVIDIEYPGRCLLSHLRLSES